MRFLLIVGDGTDNFKYNLSEKKMSRKILVGEKFSRFSPTFSSIKDAFSQSCGGT